MVNALSKKELRVVACPRPFSVDRIDCQMNAGGSIADLMRETGIDPDPIYARVFLDDVLIPKAYWQRVRPKAGHVLTIRVIPTGGGGGGKDVLRIVALIAIVAVAIFAPYAAPAAWGLTATAGGVTTLTATGAFVTAAISIAGSLAIAALIPPAKPRLRDLSGLDASTSPTLSLTGASNLLAPYGPIPRVYGRHRIFPPLAARTFTEIEGNDQYLRMLFCCGYGPLVLSELKIGTTPLEQFAGVQTELRYGFPDDPPLTLFSRDIHEDALSILLTAAAGGQTRISQANAAELSVDIAFPSGLVDFDNFGNPGLRTVQVQVEYRPVGTGGWTAVNNQPALQAARTYVSGGSNNDLTFTARTAGYAGNNIYIHFSSGSGQALGLTVYAFPGFTAIMNINPESFPTAAAVKAAIEAHPVANAHVIVTHEGDGSGTVAPTAVGFLAGGRDLIHSFSITDNRPTLVRASLRWAVSTPGGQYEVRVTRQTADTTDQTIRDQTVWTALRTIRTTVPVTLGGLALVAMRIKATDQLNGVVDQFNLIAESILPDWTGTGWVERVTSNPASIYRNILQGTANGRPLADSRLDLAGLQAWHVRCTTAGRAFNGVLDFRSTVREALRDVAAVGRASFGMKDAKFSIVEDVPQTVPIQHFTPRNSWGFRGTKVFLDQPHGLKRRFINPLGDWQQDELIVYADGFSAANATKFETLDAPFMTDPDLVWKDGRYHLAVASLRPETYELHADVENLVCTRGDLIRVTHDIPQFGAGFARVKTVTTDGGGNATAITIDDLFTMAGGTSYAVRIRRQTGASLVQQVTTVAGEQSSLTFTSPIAPANIPAIGDLVLFGVLGAESVELLVKAIDPGPDLTAKLVLVDAAPGVHQADSGTIPPFSSQITLPAILASAVPQPFVSQIKSDESVLLRHADGALESRIVISLEFKPGATVPATYVEAQFRPTGSTSAYSGLLTPVSGLTPEVSIQPVQDRLSYDIRLRSVSVNGHTSEWVSITGHTVIGKSTPPPDVQTFLREGDRLAWAYPNAPRDFAGFQLRRHFGEQRNWAMAQPLHEGLLSGTVFVFQSLDLGTVTYLVKAVDVAGNESLTAATLVLNLGDVLVENLLLTDDKKAQSFPGTITNGELAAGNLVALAASPFWPSLESHAWWEADTDPFWAAQYLQLEYLTNLLPDADQVPCTLLLDVTVVAQSWSLEYRVSGLANFWTAVDATLFWVSDAVVFWATDSESFLPWPGRLDQAVRQVYEFRLIGAGGPVQTVISNYLIKVDVPDIIDRFDDIVIAAPAGTRLPILSGRYRAISNVTLTLQTDGGTAITSRVEDKGTGGPPLTAGPLILCLNAAGAVVAGTVDATVQGY